MNKNGIMSSSDIMMQVVNYAQSGEANKIHNVWKNVVSNIHSYKDENIDSDKRIPIGQRLASNTRVVDLKNGVLLVETDHPGWIQYLNMYKNFILKGLKMQIPELQIKTLAFRLSVERPPFSLWITRIRLSLWAYSSHICGQRSGLPSSTRISSKSRKVWAKTLSTHWQR